MSSKKTKKFQAEIQEALKKRRKATSLFMDVYYTREGDASNTDVHWQEIYNFVKSKSSVEDAKLIADNYELFAKIGSLLVAKQSELFVRLFDEFRKECDEIEKKYTGNQKQTFNGPKSA